jgi:hypothetical protein
MSVKSMLKPLLKHIVKNVTRTDAMAIAKKMKTDMAPKYLEQSKNITYIVKTYKDKHTVYFYEKPILDETEKPPRKERIDKGKSHTMTKERNDKGKSRDVKYTPRSDIGVKRSVYIKNTEAIRKKGSGRKPKYIVKQKLNLNDVLDLINENNKGPGYKPVTEDELLEKLKIIAIEKSGMDLQKKDTLKIAIEDIELSTPVMYM